MKTIIAGSRHLTDQRLIDEAIIESGFVITEVVNGACVGADLLGANWAILRKVPRKDFYPDWEKYGRAAGPVRNKAMADYAEACIVVWDGMSKGSKSMIDIAKKNGLKLFTKIITP